MELVVTLALVMVLTCLWLPSLAQVQRGSQNRNCVNNGRQLLLALHLYAAEHQELLPPNEDNNTQLDGWVAGDMTQANQATNTLFLTDPWYVKLIFADGHAEIHRWQDPRTPVQPGQTLRATHPHSPDILWLTEHPTARK